MRLRAIAYGCLKLLLVIASKSALLVKKHIANFTTLVVIGSAPN